VSNLPAYVASVLDIHTKFVGPITAMADTTLYATVREAGIAAVGIENAVINATAIIPMFPTFSVSSVKRSC
jgi:hypothetical protein